MIAFRFFANEPDSTCHCIRNEEGLSFSTRSVVSEPFSGQVDVREKAVVDTGWADGGTVVDNGRPFVMSAHVASQLFGVGHVTT